MPGSRNGSIEFFIDKNAYAVSILISDKLLASFRDISGDYNPLHTSESYAHQKGFPGRVAYGGILVLCTSRLVGMCLGIDNIMLISQKIDFKLPMFVRDTILLTATITHKSLAVSVIDLKLCFTNQNNQIVALGKCKVKILP